MPDLPKKNKLAIALESGKDIRGITGYVETDLRDEDSNPILVKVKCVKVEAGSNNKACGVRVIAAPVSGVGEFYCDSCSWYDTPKKYNEKGAYDLKVQAADKARKEITNGTMLTIEKREILELAKELGLKEELRTECEERFKLDPGKTKYERLLVKACSNTAKNICIWVIANKYGVSESDMCSY